MNEVYIKSIVDILVGYQSRSKIEERGDGTHRIIQRKDFDSSGKLNLDTLVSFIPTGNPQIYSVNQGDILFQARGMEHLSYCLRDKLLNTLAAGSFYILRVKYDNILPEFLCWWLNQEFAQNYFKSHARTSAISFVSKSILEQLRIKVPPLSKQRKIIRINRLLEQEIALQKRLAYLRSQLVRSMCSKALHQ